MSEPRPADPRRDGRTTDTRARIQEVALARFVRAGFSRTTLQDIADELGLTKAAIYYHYRSKDELIASLIRPAIDDIDAYLAEAAHADLDPRPLLEGFFDLNYRHRMIFLAITRDPSGLGSTDAEGWVIRLAAQFQELLAGPDPTPDGRIRAVITASGLSRCATVLTDIPHDELRRRSVAAALQLLGAEDAAPGT